MITPFLGICKDLFTMCITDDELWIIFTHSLWTSEEKEKNQVNTGCMGVSQL